MKMYGTKIEIESTPHSRLRVPRLVEEPLFEDTNEKVSDKVIEIVNYQFENKVRDSIIKGFLFYGIPGTGKTTIAKKIAKKLKARFYFVDTSTIYTQALGASETRIKETFKRAEDQERAVILFDDVESLLINRSAVDIKFNMWEFSHDSVFFHCMDELDTSKVCVILTTNKVELLDTATIDRLYSIEFKKPTIIKLIKIMERKAKDAAMKPDCIKNMKEYMKEHSNEFESIRDVLRYLTKQYIESTKG